MCVKEETEKVRDTGDRSDGNDVSPREREKGLTDSLLEQARQRQPTDEDTTKLKTSAKNAS